MIRSTFRNSRCQSAPVLVLLLLCHGLSSGCHSSTPPATTQTAEPVEMDRSAASTVQDERGSPTPSTTSSIAQLELPGTGPIVHRPEDDGWTTEAWTESADEQLHHLSDWMIEGGGPHDTSVQELVENTNLFECGPLVPDSLQVVFEDRSLRVQRSEHSSVTSSQDVSHSEATLRGASGLVQALRQLLEPLQGANERYCKFKIFRVDLHDAGMRATILMQLSGVTPKGRIQQSATWQSEWSYPDSSERPRLRSIQLKDYERTESKLTKGTFFEDCTESILGNQRSYRQQLAPSLDQWLRQLEVGPSIVATSYHGLAVGDVNNDGLDDLYVCQPGGLHGGLPNRLYLQQPDGTARDVSAESGVDWLIETPSALIVDLDNDGDQDLVAATMAGLIFAANDGQGHFSPQSIKVLPEAPPMTLAAADYDGDGDLDVYAGCYASRAATQLVGRPVPYHDANNGARNALLRNDGNWQFSNVTRSVGLDENNQRFTMACAWEDYDNDGDMDLYVANDFGRNNLYRNDGGTFRDVAAQQGVEDISAGMSVSWGDYNRDGWMDLYVSNMWSSAGNRVAYQRRFLNESTDAKTLASFQRHARGNSLFANLGNQQDAGFRDVSLEAAVTMGRWAWSSRFADINNDGWEDLLVANGYITQDDTGDL